MKVIFCFISILILTSIRCKDSPTARSQENNALEEQLVTSKDSIAMNSPIGITLEIKERNIYRGKTPCPVSVVVTNESEGPLLLNKRLALGYRNSAARELFVEIFKKSTNEVVSVGREDYQRDPAMPEDFSYLQPGEKIMTTFDFCEWYDLPLSLEGGEYEMVVYYQADESSFEEMPKEILKGVYASERVLFEIVN